MRYPLPIAILSLVALSSLACGPSTNDASQADQREFAGTGSLIVSPEVKQLDQNLGSLEGRTDTLFAKVQSLEALVSDKMVAEDLAALRLGTNSDRAYIEVSGDDVLRVNGTAMTMDELKLFTFSQAKALCQPPPVVVVDPRANYDVVASVIDALYAQECASVEVVQQDPDKVKAHNHD